MKMIAKLVERIDEELKDAENYTEKYFEYKASGNEELASMYRKMAEDELHHADLLHHQAKGDIDRLKTVYVPPKYMLDRWEDSHIDYVEQYDLISKMLA